jgi:acyl-CoA thioesterase-2
VASAVDDLIQLLDLEQIEVNIFRGAQPKEVNLDLQRVFGGQVAGQALVAAARTVEPDRAVHSLHAYFLRPGDVSIPILYDVDHIRDGSSFTTRRVVAIQHGRAIFNLQASFQIEESGFEHALPMPDVPDPETLQSVEQRWIDAGLGLDPPERGVDIRHVEDPIFSDAASPPRFRQHVWIRAKAPLPDDPILHTCALVYASDLTMMDTTLLPHGRSHHGTNVQMASLDHAMWFHRPFRADEWLLYVVQTPSASGARGFAEGKIFDRSGHLVVSVVQEGLIRPRR